MSSSRPYPRATRNRCSKAACCSACCGVSSVPQWSIQSEVSNHQNCDAYIHLQTHDVQESSGEEIKRWSNKTSMRGILTSRWKFASCLAIPKATHLGCPESLSGAQFASPFWGVFCHVFLGSGPRSFAMGRSQRPKEKTSSSKTCCGRNQHRCISHSLVAGHWEHVCCLFITHQKSYLGIIELGCSCLVAESMKQIKRISD